MTLNEIKTGQRVVVKAEIVSDSWLTGTVTEAEGVKDKFIQLDNGDELFSFEVEKIKTV